jgi:hypothetical protein
MKKGFFKKFKINWCKLGFHKYSEPTQVLGEVGMVSVCRRGKCNKMMHLL